MLGNYVYLQWELKQRAEVANKTLATKMNDAFEELKKITEESTSSCTSKDITQLRSATFHSSLFKEVGLFNTDFTVYCSTYGPRNFSIYKSIVSRIKENPKRKTVSLVQSATLGESTFFVFYQGENGIGVNGLAPPKMLIANEVLNLMPEFPYELKVGEQIAIPQNQIIDVLDTSEVYFQDWSMALTVYLPKRLYWSRLMALMNWMILGWFFLFVGFVLGHLGYVYCRYSLHHEIKRAIQNNALEVYFQPIVSLHDDRHHEMEALIRWRSSYHGQVSPLVIIEIAERMGLIDDLTWLVIRKVGQVYREYPQQLKNISTAVNADRHCLVKESFAPKLLEILEEFPELKGRLGLEVTETSALSAVELPIMVSRFEKIKALGIRLSVDDFGTGYSGLDFLRRFPYDTLKLDKIFIDNFKEDQFTRQVLTSITKLAKELNMELIAEGVEREDQLEAMRELGVDKVQGYYFSRPLPKEKVIEWLKENTSKA